MGTESELKVGDLTVTDGYYGIVKDPKERTIMLSNGLTHVADKEEWAELSPLPLRIGGQPLKAPANFYEFLLVSHQETPEIFNYRRMLIWYIDHVGQCEGVSFLSDDYKPKEISDKEWVELQELDKQARLIAY